MSSRWHANVVSMVVPVLLLAGCKAEGAPSADSPSSSHAGAKTGSEKTARKELAKLKDAKPASMDGYSREKFGPAWKDVDHNGCDTRDDILTRDLDKVKKRDKCIVISGSLHDPYSGSDITFAKARASQVQIDHIFPLGLAWQMGAGHWTAERRTELANDRDNLLAVSGRPNEQKGDKGPAEWQPRKGYECTYAEKFIAVATEYELPVTHADHTGLSAMLDTC